MATVTIKGTRDANSGIASLSNTMNGAWFLYGQDNPLSAPAGATYYMGKWVYFQGGTYSVQLYADDAGVFRIDDVPINFQLATSYVPKTLEGIPIGQGWHKLEASYTNGPAGSPSGAAWAFYRDGALAPEIFSYPNVTGDDAGFPDIGEEPTGVPDTRLSLPVFLAKPDWSDGMTETWAWLTTINTSESGAEQRRKIRRFPRRYVEGAFRGFNNRRSILDIAVTSLGKDECLIPLWFDTLFVKDAYDAGATEILGDFANRNYVSGGILIIRKEHEPFNFELCPILSVTDTTIVLNRALQANWTNFQMYPVRVAVIDSAVSATNYHRQASDYAIRFRMTEVESKIDAAWSYDGTDLPYNGITNLPVVNIPPNWRDNLTTSFDRIIFQTDNETGIPYVMDAGNQETQDWSLPMMLNGTRQHYTFQKLLFAMAGQQMPFHAPTWMQDIVLVRDVRGADGALVAERTGYSYYGAISQDVRRWVYIRKFDGTEYINRIVGSRVEGAEEWLFLDQTIGNIPMADIQTICFMPYCRLASDTVEITHHTDISGVSEVTLAIHGFIERRDGSPANF